MKILNTNIIVSSWTSAGGTTLALMVADLLNLKYIYAGGVLKDWAKKMGYDPTSNEFHKWEDQYGEAWDMFWEDYIFNKLQNQTGYLCEGKTSGFLLPAESAFEVMVIADEKTRTERAGLDGRSESIADRDKFLAERWKRLFDIELFNIERIRQNYDFILDNSELSLGESLAQVITELLKSEKASNDELAFAMSDLPEISKELEDRYWNSEEEHVSGKDGLRKNLAAKDLYLDTATVFQDWQQNYSQKLDNLPQEMKDAVKL